MFESSCIIFRSSLAQCERKAPNWESWWVKNSWKLKGNISNPKPHGTAVAEDLLEGGGGYLLTTVFYTIVVVVPSLCVKRTETLTDDDDETLRNGVFETARTGPNRTGPVRTGSFSWFYISHGDCTFVSGTMRRNTTANLIKFRFVQQSVDS